MKKLILLSVINSSITLIVVNVSATTAIRFSVADTFPSIKLIKTNEKLIEGDLMYATVDSLYILPGTKRDAKKGLIYQQMVVPYTDIKLIRIKDFSWIGVLLLGLTGTVLLVLGIMGRASFLNDLNSLLFILLSPLILAAGFVQMFKRKQYFINGNRKKYEKFLSKLKKMK